MTSRGRFPVPRQLGKTQTSSRERFARVTESQLRQAAEAAGPPGAALLTAILLHCNAQGSCYPSYSTLGEYSGVSPRNARRIILKLEAVDLLRCERRPGTSILFHVGGQNRGHGGRTTGATPASPKPDRGHDGTAPGSRRPQTGATVAPEQDKEQAKGTRAPRTPSRGGERGAPTEDSEEDAVLTEWTPEQRKALMEFLGREPSRDG